MPKGKDTRISYDLTKIFWSGAGEIYNAYPGLQGWWRLNEDVSSTGDVTDSSGNDRDGTFDASDDRPTFSPLETPSTHIQDNSYTFDASDDAINIGTAATWDAIIGNDTSGGSPQKMSFSAWIYKTGDGGGSYGRIIDFGNTDLLFYTDPAEGMRFYTWWNSAAVVWISTTPAFSLNTWAHVVATYDANSDANVPIIYVNGVSQTVTESGTTPTGTWRGIDTEACYIGNRQAGTGAWEGNLADVAVWNKILSPSDVLALYNATKGIYGFQSGYLNNPPRTTLHTRDNATGSYPTIARTTGFANTTGVYSSSFDDTNTVIFTTDFARVKLVVVNDRSPGSVDSQGRWSSNQITLTTVDSTAIVFEFNWGPEQTPSSAAYITIDLRPPALDFGIKRQVPIRVQIATALMKAIAGAGVGFSATVSENVVTVTQAAPGSLTTPGTAKSLANNVRVYDMVMSGTNAWSGGSSDPVSYPTLLQPSYVGMLTGSSRMPAGMIATPNLNSDISTTAVVRKGIADSGLEFTKGQDLLPFDESRVPAKDPLDEFQEVGTPETVIPGFSAPLWSKTQIVIDTNPITSTSVFFSTGSALVTNESSYADHQAAIDAGVNSGMVYFDFKNKRWNVLGDLTTGSNVDRVGGGSTHAGSTYVNQPQGVTSSFFSFFPNDMTWRSNPPAAESAYGAEGYRTAGAPISTFGFPTANRFSPTGSQMLDMSQYITEPFLLEKVEFQFSGAFPRDFAVNVSEVMYKRVAGDNRPESFLGPNTSTFFLMNQFAPAGSEFPIRERSSTYKKYYHSPTQNMSSVADLVNTASLYYSSSVRELITYGTINVLPSQRRGGAGQVLGTFGLGDYQTHAPWLLKDLSILREMVYGLTDATGIWTDKIRWTKEATGSFSVKAPVRVAVNQELYGYFTTLPAADSPGQTSFGRYQYGSDGIMETSDVGMGEAGWQKGARDGLGMPSGRSIVASQPGMQLSYVREEQASYAPLGPIPVAKEQALVSPYLLMPTDKLVLGFSNNAGLAKAMQYGFYGPYAPARDGNAYSAGAPDDTGPFYAERALSQQAVQLCPGAGKLILYGSLVKDGKEYNETTNQWLTSDALHEMPGSSVLDQWDVEPLQSFSGSYIDNIVSGSLLPSEAGDPGMQNAAALSLDKVSMQSFGRPRMAVGSSVGGLKAGIGGYQGQGFIGAIWIAGLPLEPTGPFWLTDGAGRRVKFTGDATGPARNTDDHYYFLAASAATLSAIVMTTNFYNAIALAISDGNLSMVAYDPNLMPTVSADLSPVQLAQVFPGTAGNTAIELNSSNFVYANAGPALGADADHILGGAGDGQFFGGTAATLDSAPPSIANPALSRNVTLVDSAERFYDSMVAYPTEYYLANGTLIYDGEDYGGSSAKAPGNGQGELRVMATKGGVKGEGLNDALLAYDTVWAGAFPFESRYRALDRKLSFDNWKESRGSAYVSTGNRRSVAIQLFVSSSAGQGLFAGEPRIRQRITVPREATNSYPITSSYVGDSLTGQKQNTARARRAVQRWFFGSGDGPAGMPKLNLYETVALTAQSLDGNWRDGEDTGTWVSSRGDPEGLLRGWKYGLISALPYNSQAVYHREHYGQMRDMLEQRLDSMFYGGGVWQESLSGHTRVQKQVPAVRCMFVDSTTGRRTSPADTHCQNLSTFMTSSVPFFDAFRVRTGPANADFSVGGQWTYGRDRDDDPDLLQEATISLT
jgi:hypothetical protein